MDEDDGLDPEEFEKLFGDDLRRNMENVEMDETARTLVELFYALRGRGLGIIESAAIVAMLLRVMGLDDGESSSDSESER